MADRSQHNGQVCELNTHDGTSNIKLNLHYLHTIYKYLTMTVRIIGLHAYDCGDTSEGFNGALRVGCHCFATPVSTLIIEKKSNLHELCA